MYEPSPNVADYAAPAMSDDDLGTAHAVLQLTRVGRVQVSPAQFARGRAVVAACATDTSSHLAHSPGRGSPRRVGEAV